MFEKIHFVVLSLAVLACARAGTDLDKKSDQVDKAGEGSYSCMMKNKTGAPRAAGICREYRKTAEIEKQKDQYKSACERWSNELTQATWSDGECSRAGSVGVCTIGGRETVVYYSIPIEEARQYCVHDRGSFSG